MHATNETTDSRRHGAARHRCSCCWPCSILPSRCSPAGLLPPASPVPVHRLSLISRSLKEEGNQPTIGMAGRHADRNEAGRLSDRRRRGRDARLVRAGSAQGPGGRRAHLHALQAGSRRLLRPRRRGYLHQQQPLPGVCDRRGDDQKLGQQKRSISSKSPKPSPPPQGRPSTMRAKQYRYSILRRRATVPRTARMSTPRRCPTFGAW